jgi:ParB/RepB/Spo0J family partition protein
MAAEIMPHRYEVLPVDSVTPHPDNPRRGDLDAIADSIETTGFFGALLVQDSTRYILVGNHRWEAARGVGLTELPALVIDCDDDTAKRILLADNRYAELARWDDAALVTLLNGMAVTPQALAGTGYSERDLADLIRAAQPKPGRDYGDDLDTQHTCPRCGYQWNGAA